MTKAHHRSSSRYGDGPRMTMCRERRAVWRARLTMFRRARKITPLHEDIGLAMLRRLGADGRLDPSHETVADDVGCDPRSVRRALAGLKAFGMVLWVNRIVRAGWRVAQTSNAYMLTLGEPASILAICSGGQRARLIFKKESISCQKPALEVSAEERKAAQEMLAAVAEARRKALGLG
jgi:hypothetical protein